MIPFFMPYTAQVPMQAPQTQYEIKLSSEEISDLLGEQPNPLCEASFGEGSFSPWKFEYNGNSWDAEFIMQGYSASANGDARTVNWTSNPGVDGVIAKAGTEHKTYSGGTSGTVDAWDHDLSNIVACVRIKPTNTPYIPTWTPTDPSTPTPTSTQTKTMTQTYTATFTMTATGTLEVTVTPSYTPSVTGTPGSSMTPSYTPTGTLEYTPTGTLEASITPTLTETPGDTPTPSATLKRPTGTLPALTTTPGGYEGGLLEGEIPEEVLGIIGVITAALGGAGYTIAKRKSAA